MAPPIQFGLGLSLARAGGVALDADAKAYIAAVETAGATVSGGQKKAIDTFVKTGKSDGWYSSLKRMYLPIWASASPNAIDMIALGSGTFNGTVTHGAGFVQGDGSTGYFDTGSTQSNCSITASSAYYAAVVKVAATSTNKAILGVGSSSNNMLFRASSTTQVQARHFGLADGEITSSTTTSNAILSFSRNAGDRTIWRRSSSTRTAIAGPTTGIDSGTTVISNIFTLAFNNSSIAGSAPAGFSNAEFGAFAIGTGLTDAQDGNFTLALKNLWEGTTGLTLP
jgi:hypothetical protein